MHQDPSGIAQMYPELGQKKAEMPFSPLFVRAILAGAYIAMAAVGSHSIACLIENTQIAALVSALLFPTGLAMVLLVGGELFTGNHLMTLAMLKKRISLGAMIRSWGIVFLGNFLGAVIIAALIYAARQGDSAFGSAVIRAAQSRAVQSVSEAFFRGVLCNFFVCTAVWMSYSTKSPHGKILIIYFPVMMFVLSGTEHCIANLYFQFAGLFFGAGKAWQLLANLIPVTIGNIVGGAICFSGALWFSYLRQASD